MYYRLYIKQGEEKKYRLIIDNKTCLYIPLCPHHNATLIYPLYPPPNLPPQTRFYSPGASIPNPDDISPAWRQGARKKAGITGKGGKGEICAVSHYLSSAFVVQLEGKEVGGGSKSVLVMWEVGGEGGGLSSLII